MFENIDFSPGKITWFSFDIDPSRPLNNDNMDLHEDMLQVKYPNDFVIDAGWYRGGKHFVIHVIKKSDWEKPIITKTCKTIEKLEIIIEDCIHKVRDLIEKENNTKKTNQSS